MIRLSDGKIGSREYISLVMLTIGLKLADTTPTFLFLSGGNAGWLLPAVAYLLVLLPLLVLFSVMKSNPGKGLLDITMELTGTYGGTLIGFVFSLIIFVVTVINSRSYIDIVNTMVYQRTPIPILYFFIVAAACFVAYRGLETIGRVAWLVLPYVVFCLYLLFITVWQDIDWLHLFPLAGPGVDVIVREGTVHSSILGEIFFLAALAPHYRNAKAFGTASIIGLSLSVFNMVITMVVYLAVFDYPAIEQMAYPFQQLTRASQVGQVITHVESVFLFFWLICSVIHFAVYLYLIAFFFARTLRIQEFKQLILPFAGIVVLLGLIPENINEVSRYRGMLIEGCSPIYILFPFILWALDKWKRRGSP